MNKDKIKDYEEESEGDDGQITKAFFGSLAVIVVIAVVGVIAYFVLSKKPEKKTAIDNQTTSAKTRTVDLVVMPKVTFTNITDSAGIEFVHNNGGYGQKLLPETMGGGVAFFDYDNDEDPDLLFVNSTTWEGQQPADPAPTMCLYQNDGKGNFTDVTEEVGLNVGFYGMGVAVGDIDNDGWRDLYFSAVGKNRLFKNNQGKFVDITESSGAGGAESDWGTSCGFFDFDKDGLLDLFVCNYIEWTPEIDLGLESTLDGQNRAYAPPRAFNGAFPSLFKNLGDGKFEDVSVKANIQVKNSNTGVPVAKALGSVFFDFNGDGWQDIFVACDTVRNLVFENNKDGTFSEIGQGIGVAYDRDGNARGAMGIDVASFRDDGSVGVVIGNFANEMVSLYVAKQGSMNFTDNAVATGLGPQTRDELTFGLFFLDYDLDGRLDMMTSNGHLEDDIQKIQKSQRYEQPPHLFWNAGEEAGTEFVEVPDEEIGKDFSEPIVGRGTATADIDGDGDLDIIITASGSKPRLLRNDQETGNNWTRVRLAAKEKNLDAIGAKLEFDLGERKIVRFVSPTCSYLSQRELTSTIGLGKSSSIKSLTITWPDGSQKVVKEIELNKTNVIVKE